MSPPRPDPQIISREMQEALVLQHQPLGFRYEPFAPPGALGFVRPGGGCITPLILAASKGKPAAFDAEHCGWPCSAFYLGFRDSIYPGIERFLSHGPFPDRACERFVRTPAQVEEYLRSVRFRAPEGASAVFRPLGEYPAEETPQLVIVFGNADQLSGLAFLLHYDAPNDDQRVATRFCAACASLVTHPLQYLREGRPRAVWGCHDPAARERMPAELMSLTIPWTMLAEAWRFAGESFLGTPRWAALSQRFPRSISSEGASRRED
jgi:hypothetical protein